MAHIQTPQINWLDSAWEISAVLAGMPSHPTNALAWRLNPDDKKQKGQPLGEDVIDAIEILLMAITLRLAYRLQVHHKAHKKLNGRPIDLDNRDPRVTLKAIERIESGGIVLDSSDFSAFDAHIKLCRILMDRFVCVEWKRTLPLLVASIGGATTTQTATLKATQSRARVIELKDAKLQAQKLCPGYSCSELLNWLEGEGIVTNWDNASIEWVDVNGTTKRTATSTFRNWKAKPKK